MSYSNRYIEPLILEALQVSPIVFINGARQTGKSTLVQGMLNQIGKNGKPAVYATFDKPTIMAAASTEPEAFLSAHETTLVIDEVQMVPGLFRALKIAVDELRLTNKGNANGKYLLTGSANILALPKLAESLVGRMSVLTLYPFTAAEATGGIGDGLDRLMRMDFSNITDRNLTLTDAIKLGTFPEIIRVEKKVQDLWLDGYLATMLQREVKQFAQLEKIFVLPNLLRVLATRAGGLINDSDIARELGLNSVTGKFYRNMLKMMFLNFDVQPWFRNIGKRLVKAPKGYLIDTLMLCHMLELDIDDIAVNKPDLFGHVLENFVATELVKQLSIGNTKANLHHFRTSDGKEVDFILEKPDGSVFAIEIKRSESVGIQDFKGIKAFAELTGKDFTGGIVLYSGKEVVPFGKNLWAVPFFILWQ